MSTEAEVATALLGSWPSQVAQWGREGIAAYMSELAARGVTPDRALVAIRLCPAGQTWPPSVPELAALARRDPGAPTFAEMMTLVFGDGGVLTARTAVRKGPWGAGERDQLDREAMLERAGEMHPLVGSFVERQTLDYLRQLNLEDEYGAIRRRDLQRDWDAHLAAVENRDVTALTTRRRGEIGRLDPLGVLRRVRPVAEIAGGDK
jgi:hypothetical protein